MAGRVQILWYLRHSLLKNNTKLWTQKLVWKRIFTWVRKDTLTNYWSVGVDPFLLRNSVNFSEMTFTKCFQLALISFLIFKRTHTYEDSCALSSIGFMVNSPWEMSPIIFIRTWGHRTQLLLRNGARTQIPTAWFKILPPWSPSYTANYWALSWKTPGRTVLRENKLSLPTTDQNNVFFDE